MKATKGEWTVHNQDWRNGDTLIIHPPVGENGIYPFYATVSGVEMRKAAHLIAAAPDMYEALKLIVQRAGEPLFQQAFNAFGQGGMAKGFVAEAKMAISKAEGK